MLDQSQPAATQPTSSFLTRATNVFSSPGELFTEVASAPPQTTSWLIPYLISLVVAVVFTFSLFNNTTLRQQIFDMQTQGMQKAVEQGKMTQEQLDRVKEGMESSGPAMFMVIGGGGAVLWLSCVLFAGALLLWLAAKFLLKFTGSYKKMLEVFGLSTLIGILGSIVTLLMMNMLDSFYASPGGALAVYGSFDPMNKAHRLLAALNVFTLWQVGVLGIGMAKVSNKPAGTGAGLAYGLWAAWTLLSTLTGIGMR